MGVLEVLAYMFPQTWDWECLTQVSMEGLWMAGKTEGGKEVEKECKSRKEQEVERRARV